MKRSLPARRGVMLLDVLVAIGLIAVFALLAVTLLRMSLRVSHDSSYSQDLAARFDNAVGQLRRDVWGASSMELRDGKTIQISAADATIVTWQIAEDGTISRSAGESKQQWANIGSGLSAKIDGPVMTLTESDSKQTGRAIALVSRPIASKGAKP